MCSIALIIVAVVTAFVKIFLYVVAIAIAALYFVIKNVVNSL